MPGRSWVPSDYLDEISPPGRETPSHWIARHAVGDHYVLAPAWSEGEPEGLKVQLGEIVGFHCTDDHGEVRVTIRRNGTYDCHGKVPAEASHFWIHADAESLGSSLAEFVKHYVDSWPDQDDATEHTETVRMAAWSDDLPHMLVINDGKPHFAMVVGARARQ